MITQFIDFIKAQFENQVFTGVFTASIMTGVVFFARSLPAKIWNWYKYHYTFFITINNDVTFYEVASKYLVDSLKKKNRLKVYQNQDERKNVLGYGMHYFWSSLNLVMFNISEEKMENSLQRKESIDLRVYGISPKKAFDKFWKSLEDFESSIKVSDTNIFIYGYNWDKIKSTPKRTLDSIFIDESDKKEIIKDVDNFVDAEKFYEDHNIPWVRGYIFYGGAGNGKTTMCYALAHYLERNLCFLNLAEFNDNNELKNAFYNIPKQSIVVLDDVDASPVVHKRTGKPTQKEKGIDLSCILGLMDGLLIPQGTIIIATTNHFDQLDPAFVRNGRFDVKKEFKYADKQLATKMVDYYDLDKEEVLSKFNTYPVCQAEIQTEIFKRL